MTFSLRILIMGMIDLVRDYAAVLAVLLLLRLVGAYILARAVLHPDLGRRRIALAASSFCLLYWCTLPATGDSMFWLNGAIEYELTATGMLVFLSLLWRRELTLSRSLGLAVGTVFLAGGHEVAGLSLVAVVAAGCALAWNDRRSDLHWWLLLVVAALAGLLVVLLAPGNFVRADRLAVPRSVPRSLAATAINILAWTPRWLLDGPVLLAASVLVLDPTLSGCPEIESHK